MGRRLKKLQFSRLSVAQEEFDGQKESPSLSGRLRSWLSSKPTKYVTDKSNTMRALIRIEELHKPLPSKGLARQQGECRRQKVSYLQRLKVIKRSNAAYQLVAAGVKRETRISAFDMFATAAETAAKQQSAALDHLANMTNAYMEEIGPEADDRIQASQEGWRHDLENEKAVVEDGLQESLTALEVLKDEDEREEQMVTMLFEQDRHQNNSAAQDEIDELKSLLSARIADLEAEFDKMREDNEARNARDLKQYRDLVASDAVLASEIRSNMKAIAKIRTRFEQLRMTNLHFRDAEASQQNALRHRIAMMSRAFRRLQSSVAHWKRAADGQVKELSLIAFQERTKMKMFVSKTVRILKRWAVAGKLDPPEQPGESFERRVAKRRWELHLLRQQLQQTRRRHQQLLAELNQTAHESGVPLQKVIQVRDLVSAFGAEGARREMIKSRS